ncbi:indole-3-glycerol phosphate synthase TrpC [Gemmatimonas groenlandica]|uniref:indole-3-glycerol phosphate synthase TrpC n=1 Tax=Gemmatimonas groenlandica TaxID=2732249 RepID=UPI003CCCAC10
MWTFPSGTLGDLTRASHERAHSVLSTLPELRSVARDLPSAPDAAELFAKALRGPTIRVIAEVKRASPSKGAINLGIDAAAQAARYVEGGAAAISVLTEPSRFGGALGDLADVAARVAVPAIRKDFLVHPVQLWEARVRGAAAALLIVRALSPSELPLLMDAARECGLATLVEIRDEAELERALEVGATVIGVNNRNLETLIIDPTTAPTLIPRIPAHCVAVAESGMQTPDDVAPSALAGADAILVGSAISASADPASAVRALAAIPRSASTRR